MCERERQTASERENEKTKTNERLREKSERDHLVIELADVFLDVWQQSSEGELLDELADAVMVIEGQAGTMSL